MLIGLFLAALASALFNASVVLQAIEARAVPSEHGLRLSLLGCLARRPRWLAGIALSAGAVGLQILALTMAPLTVVQPADAAGLVLLSTVGSRALGERTGRRELISVVGIIVGILAIVLATPARSADEVSSAGMLPGLLVVAAVAAAPYIARHRAGAHSLLVVLGAGFAFAASSFSIKLVANSLASSSWLSLALVAVIAASTGFLGLLSEQTALQRRQATQVTPIVFVIELVIPLLLAITIGGESWGSNPLSLCSITAGLGLLIVSVVVLMRTPAVSQLLAGDGQRADAKRQTLVRVASAPALV
jgi:drug/metabolite transporter (DMT)-like permease